jgi:regulator of protease activity HflC (stomatin/prohibitin superfamily)
MVAGRHCRGALLGCMGRTEGRPGAGRPHSAIAWGAQTALRVIIGQMTLAEILFGRAVISE